MSYQDFQLVAVVVHHSHSHSQTPLIDLPFHIQLDPVSIEEFRFRRAFDYAAIVVLLQLPTTQTFTLLATHLKVASTLTLTYRRMECALSIDEQTPEFIVKQHAQNSTLAMLLRGCVPLTEIIYRESQPQSEIVFQ